MAEGRALRALLLVAGIASLVALAGSALVTTPRARELPPVALSLASGESEAEAH